MAKTSTVKESFTTFDPAIWKLDYNPANLGQITGGQAVLAPLGPGLWTDIISLANYDLTGSEMLVEAVQVETDGTTYFDLAIPDTGYVGFAVWTFDNTLRFFEQTVPDDEDAISIPYDPIAHRWWRLREISGTLYWDTSPDGITWVNRRSKTAVTSFVSGFFELFANGTGTSVFDNLNIAPLPAVIYYDYPASTAILDRIRFTIIEANTNRILTRDLVVKEPEITLQLSAPSIVSFKIDQGEQQGSSFGINWKNWGQLIVPELETSQFGRVPLGAQIVTNNSVDPKTGDMIIDGTGFLGYPKGLPWLENFNPIAVDPAEIIQRIMAHIESFTNANLGVDVQPSSTGTQMLPGIGFDGNTLSFDFFAIFIRAVDFPDCGDQISSLARDLPLDLFEEVEWNVDRTELSKTIRLAYPHGGFHQDHLAFRLGENVINAEKAEELDIEPVSDVIIRSWLPGKTYSSQLSNADMTRYRRTVMEEDAAISGSERAAAWAKRKLTRRNIPKSFKTITIDPNHPNAPFGSWWLGDTIYVQCPNYPWYGDIREWHRITSITIKEEPTMDLGLKVEGAFNYDPIEYDPDAETEPPFDPNRLHNGYFTSSLAGWIAVRGQWIRVATSGYSGDGCVRIDCDDVGEELEGERIPVTPGEHAPINAAVRYQEIVQTGSPAYTFAVAVNTYKNGGVITRGTIVDSFVHDGTGPFTPMTGTFEVPDDDTVNEISLSFLVNSAVTGGIAFWDDARVLPPI